MSFEHAGANLVYTKCHTWSSFGLHLMIDGKLRYRVILRKNHYLNTLLKTKINWRAFETNFRNTEMDFAFSNKSILKSTYSFLVKMKDSTWALVLNFCSWVGSIISEFCSQTLQRSQQHFLSVLPGLWGGLWCLSGVEFCCAYLKHKQNEQDPALRLLEKEGLISEMRVQMLSEVLFH